MDFTIESYYNPHLAVGADRIDAIFTVTATNGEVYTSQNQGSKAIVFVLDVSGSMQEKDKLAQGKLALRRCIDLLDEKCLFSVITFSFEAEVIVPMSLATEFAKAQAHQRIQKLYASGGTCMSRALLAVLKEFRSADNAIGFVQFVTDGDNDRNDRQALENALQECEGKYQCDCWGVGTDWRPDELRKIAGRLLGTADAVPNPEQLEMHFKGALQRALAKGIGDVRLRLQLPKTCKILTAKQMSPEIADLIKLTKKVDDKNTDIPLGAWGAESRDYHVAFQLESQVDGEEMMVCRPKVVYSEDGSEIVVDGQRVIAAWTSDEALTARINSQLAHYTGQEELADSIREGLEAKARGDIDRATVLLGKAAKIAIQSGNDEVTMRLKKVVDVVDVEQGTVRLRSSANKAADLELDMGGTRTIRRRPAANNQEGK